MPFRVAADEVRASRNARTGMMDLTVAHSHLTAGMFQSQFQDAHALHCMTLSQVALGKWPSGFREV
jgi:hypothetical protein